jgi:hypothetical protein
MDETNIASYADVKDKLRPFDLIAFHGGDCVSALISELESFEVGVGAFSHVGMVVTADILPEASFGGNTVQLKPNHPYVFESTFSYDVAGLADGAHDVVTGKGAFGVQLRDLEEVIPRYITNEKTKVAWCRLLNNPFDPLPDEPAENLALRRKLLEEEFTEFFKKYEQRTYEADIGSLLASMFPALRPLRTIRDDIFKGLYSVLHSFGIAKNKVGPAGWEFCSQLVATVYQSIGVIGPKFNPEDVVPVDFFGCDKDGIPALVDKPVYFRDWALSNEAAFRYAEDSKPGSQL